MAAKPPHRLEQAAEQLLALTPRSDLLTRWAGAGRFGESPFAALKALLLQLLRERPDLARRLLDHLEASNAIDDPVDALQLLRLRAHVAKAMGELPRALRAYAQVARAFTERGDELQAARTVIGWSDALALAGESARALHLIDQHRAVVRRLDPGSLARMDGSAATVHYLAGRLDRAQALYRGARRRALRRGQRVDAAVCAFNLGNVELLRGRAARARRSYQSAHAVFDEAGLELAVLQCRYGIAAARLHCGEGSDAITEFDRVAEQLRERGDRRGAAAIDYDAAELLASLGADRMAEVHARRARADFASMGLLPEQARAAALHARILARLGRLHDARRRLQEASDAFAAMGRNDVLERLDLDRTALALAQGATRGLRSHLRRTARRIAHNQDLRTRTRCRILQAELALQEVRPLSALRFALRAHRDARSHPLRAWRPQIALIIARAHALAGRSAQAEQWARRAVNDLDRQVRNFGDQAAALGLGRARESVTAAAIDLVLAHGGPRAARKAVKLLMAVHASSVVDDLLRGRRRAADEDLRAALARLRDRLLAANDAPRDIRSSALQGEIDQLERRLHSRRDGPSTPRPIELQCKGSSEWMQRSAGCPLVIFDRRGDRWRAFVVEGTAQVRQVLLPHAEAALQGAWIPLRMLFEALANTPVMARKRLLERTEGEARAALRTLHDALWSPLVLDAPEVIVVATGVLNGMAVEAALIEVYGGRAPVLGRIPHPELLVENAPAPSRHALLLAGPVPGAQREIASVGARLRRAGWTTSRESTRAGFARTGSRCGLVHVAAHGSYHRSRWISNGVLLEDGWLGFEQLDACKIEGALLYFDSCESGLAYEAPGAELDGWATAGFAAGAHEIVLNLWKVDDESATGFASAFYEKWCGGRSAARAIQDARLRMREEQAHPFTWAAAMVTSRQPFRNADLITPSSPPHHPLITL